MATPRKARLTVPCEWCRAAFEQRNSRRRFCSPRCRAADWQAARRDREARLRDRVKALAKDLGLTPEDFS